jgi:hypothetical protein
MKLAERLQQTGSRHHGMAEQGRAGAAGRTVQATAAASFVLRQSARQHGEPERIFGGASRQWRA